MVRQITGTASTIYPDAETGSYGPPLHPRSRCPPFATWRPARANGRTCSGGAEWRCGRSLPSRRGTWRTYLPTPTSSGLGATVGLSQAVTHSTW